MPFGPGMWSYDFTLSAIDSEMFRTLNSLLWRQRLLSSFVFSLSTAFANSRIFLHLLNDRFEHSIFRQFYVSKNKNMDEIQLSSFLLRLISEMKKKIRNIPINSKWNLILLNWQEIFRQQQFCYRKKKPITIRMIWTNYILNNKKTWISNDLVEYLHNQFSSNLLLVNHSWEKNLIKKYPWS